MAENLCKNCKYWTQHVGPYKDTHFGSCSNEKFVYTFTSLNKDVPDDGLGYWDEECYKAYFETGENFGCIHFESKVKENG